MISGDQIIAHITPYVGISYMSQEADPLGSWLYSLNDMLEWISPKVSYAEKTVHLNLVN